MTMTKKGDWKSYYDSLKRVNNFFFLLFFIFAHLSWIFFAAYPLFEIKEILILGIIIGIISITVLIFFIPTEMKKNKLDKILELRKHGTINENDFQRLMNKHCKLL